MTKPIICAGLLLVGLITLIAQLNRGGVANRDFIQYWAASKLLLHGANPYDATALTAIERSAGLTKPPIIIWNTPFILPVILPLGTLAAKLSLILWLLSLIVCLAISVHIVHDLNGRPRNRLHLIGYCFAPALGCLFAGQVSFFALLGLVLFLRFHSERPFFAGAALSLCAVKPHLFIAFGIALLVWCISRRSYWILYGAALAISLWLSASLVIDPVAWTQYSQLARVSGMNAAPVPTFSVILRAAISPKSFLMQFALSAGACLWAVVYVRKHSWNWLTDGSLLMLVSVWSAPYSWFYDEAVLLPAILGGVYCIANNRGSLLPFLAIQGLAFLEIIAKVPMGYGYFWTTTAWLAWYLYDVRYDTLNAGSHNFGSVVRAVS